MVMKADSRGIPPYIGWTTWNRLTRLMKTFVPPRLDRSYFNSLGFSGTQYSQAIRAFLFLNLMDDTKRPTEALRKLIMGTDEERKATLKSAIEKAYQPFFKNPGPQIATLGDLQAFLRNQGAKGVLDKCVTFFLSAAQEADIELSPQLTGELGRKTGQRGKTRRKALPRQPIMAMKLPPRRNALQPATPLHTTSGTIDMEVVSFVAELQEDQQDRWIRAYVKLMKAMQEQSS